MKVIAISGWKRSGKDTIAEQLIKEHSFKRVAFADPLKDASLLIMYTCSAVCFTYSRLGNLVNSSLRLT